MNGARPTVAGEIPAIPKQQLHALVMLGWARAIARLGKGRFADLLDITGPGIDKQLAGSMPGFDLIDRAFDVEPTILDDWIARKGKRFVDKDAVCSTDDIGLVMARLFAWLHEARHRDSPGGGAVTHGEKLAAETMVRDLHAELGRFLDELSEIRRPRAVRG